MKQNALQFFWWLKHLMYLWVRSKVFPKEVKTQLHLDPEKPVVYLLQTRSFTNLLVLDHYCEKEGLPRPLADYKTIKGSSKAAWLYLTKPGLITQKRSKSLPAEFYDLVQQAQSEGFDVQIVPVSVFWGRNPGKEEKSLFKLFFFDEEYGGLLQRFVTFFVQGRNVFCNFGKPISLQATLSEGVSAQEATKKLRRVLRVHFKRQRETVLGPYIYDRAQVISSMLSSKVVREAMEYEAKKKGVSLAKMEDKGRKYADEVCAKASYHAIRFFDILLGWLWKKIYSGLEVKHSEQIRDLAERYELVYMPSHRSHMDYLLIGYVLYYLGLLPPHTIAGVNLNFWPAGPLLRRGGGIFIRRTFGGDRLYAVIVSEFVQYLLTAGFPFCFYPEGGRSRTGFLLPPKLGILSMVVQGCLQKQPKKPIMLVPVYVGYDQIMEGHSYQKELGGRAKKSESFRQLLKSTKILKRSFGRAYLGFGEPLELKSYLEQQFPQSNTALPAMVSQVADEMMQRTNAAAVLTPVSLFSLIIVSTPKKALSEEDLLAFAAKLLELLRACPQGSRVTFPEGLPLKEELLAAEKLGQFARYQHPSGDVIYASEQQGAMLGYYRNNILHMAAIPALIAGFLRHNDAMQENKLVERCSAMYAFFKQELYLSLPSSEADAAVRDCLAVMHQTGFLVKESLAQTCPSSEASLVHRPQVVSKEFSYFRILGRMLGPLAEKYAIYAILLARYLPKGTVTKEGLSKECQLMSQRLAILNGLADVGWYDELSFGHFMSLCLQARYLKRQNLETEQEAYEVLAGVEGLSEMFLDLLSYDVRQSLKRAAFDGK